MANTSSPSNANGDGNGNTSPNNAARTAKKTTRARPLPPNVMARNLAIEKQRREALNEDFLDLARLVPGLAHVRRLSKVLIVNESIRHFRQQRAMCIAAARDMQELLAENAQLVSEVNALRSQMGVGIGVQPKQVTAAMAQLLSVEHETLGTFPAGFGDNHAYQPGETVMETSTTTTTTTTTTLPAIRGHCGGSSGDPPADDPPIEVGPHRPFAVSPQQYPPCDPTMLSTIFSQPLLYNPPDGCSGMFNEPRPSLPLSVDAMALGTDPDNVNIPVHFHQDPLAQLGLDPMDPFIQSGPGVTGIAPDQTLVDYDTPTHLYNIQ